MGEWLLGEIDRGKSAVAYREIGSIMVKTTRGMVGSEDAMIGMRRRTQSTTRATEPGDETRRDKTREDKDGGGEGWAEANWTLRLD